MGTAFTIAGVVAVVVIATAVLTTLVNVGGVHRYLIGLAQKEATAKLGVPVSIQNFTLHLAELRVDLYGTEIAGAAPLQRFPLLRVNHIEASLRIVSLLHLSWYLNRLQIDHPVVWIVHDKNGNSNLPRMAGNAGQSNQNLFRIEIRDTVVNNGALYLNDHSRLLNANLREFAAQIGYSNQPAYIGNLAYSDGHLQFGSLRPIPHNLSVSFAATPRELILNRAAIKAGRTTLVASGRLSDYSDPDVRIHYAATVDTGQLDSLLPQPPLQLTGLIQIDGDAAYRRAGAQPPLQALTLNGEVASDKLWLHKASIHVPLTHLTARFLLANGNASVSDFNAGAMGGEVTATASASDLGGKPHGSANASLRGVSLTAVQQALPYSGLSSVVTGQLTGSTSASWGPAAEDLEVKADFAIAGRMRQHAPHSELAATTLSQSATTLNRQQTGMPLESHIKGDYSRSHQRLHLADSYIRTPETTLSLTGSISRTSSLAVHLQANDLTELADFSDLLPGTKAAQTLRSLGLAGEASFQGTVSGTIAAPQITGHLAASPLHVNGSQWKTVRTDVQLSPTVIRLQNAHLELASQGQINLDANAALDHWSVSKTTQFAVSGEASNIDVADLRRLAHRNVPVTGILNARLHVHGNIEALDGSGSIHLTRATAYRQPVPSAVLSFSAAKGQIETNLGIDIAGGVVKAVASIRPDNRAYVAQITSSGVRLDEIQRLRSRGVNATGVIAFDAEGRGTLDNPEIKARLRISRAVIENHPISGVNLQINLEHRLMDASLKANVAQAPVEAQAKVSLTANYPADISLNTEPVPLQTLLALYRPELAASISGLTEVHLTLHGPLKNMKAIEGQATIPTLKISYQNRVNLAATAPIHVDYRDGLLNLQPVQISGTDTDLRLQGTIPLQDHTPTSLQVAGTIDLQIAQLFDPELRSAGTARINIHTSNAPNSGGFTGTVEIANASLASAAFPVGLQDGNGMLNVTGNRIDISSFRGTVGGGAVVAQGGVSLRPALAFDLGLTASDVNVLYPQGVRDSFSANLRFTGSYERALLGGSIAVSDVAFTPGFDFMSTATQFSGGVATPTAPGFLQNIALNVAVHSTETLSPVSRTLSAAGTAELEIRGTAAHPSLLGRVNLTGGSMLFHGNRYVLTGGTVQFVNPAQIRPVLNLSLSTTIQQYNIDLRFTGPADQLRGEYTSNPSLPRVDIISLLAFGTTTEASATGPNPANQAVKSLASQASGQITSRISKIAGISQLSVSPVLAGNTAQGPPGAVITIRQQVTGNLFVTFSTNVASTQSQTIQGEYRLSPRVSISATRDPNGGFAVDALIKRSW